MSWLIDELLFLFGFIVENFVAIWPYLLLTIPLSVGVNLLGASKYINRAFRASPLVAIVLAAAVGAFSPFCSCTVIPVVAALLIGGVPLAPVMAFWVASPSMDPEIFLLSVATLGWNLAVWRLMATLVISLAAGFITHLAVNRGWLGEHILRMQQAEPFSLASWTRRGWRRVTRAVFRPAAAGHTSAPIMAAAGPPAASISLTDIAISGPGCCSDSVADPVEKSGCDSGGCAVPSPIDKDDKETAGESAPSIYQRLWPETWAAIRLVVRFMLLAFFLEALIVRYVPQELIIGLLGADNPLAVLAAALIGVPVYTSNLTALPLVGGLLEQGMLPGAALAFLVAGPMTTLPAMTAVWQLASRRVFTLYLSFALLGALVSGYLLTWLS